MGFDLLKVDPNAIPQLPQNSHVFWYEDPWVSSDLLGLILLDKGVLRAHQQVITKHGNGEITSGSFSPTLQQSIALVRLPLGVQIGDSVDVDIRGKLLKAKVTKPVFARNGKAVI